MGTLLEYFNKTEAEVTELLQDGDAGEGPTEVRPNYYSVKETSEILQTNLNTLRSWIHRGHVRPSVLGVMFDKRDLYYLATILSLISGGFTLAAALQIAALVIKYLASNGVKPRVVHSGHLGDLQRKNVALSLNYEAIRREVDVELERRGYLV